MYKEGRNGDHLNQPYATLVAGLREMCPRGVIGLSDVAIVNIVADNITSESGTMKLLSGIRQICSKAFGNVPQLAYDKEATEQLKAQARRNKARKPRYTTPVDFGGDSGVWMSIVAERERVNRLSDTSSRKAMVLRNHAIFLERHDAISRSDCETKYDFRLEEYFRVYNHDGEQQRQPNMSEQLDACLLGDGGVVWRRYLNPKDPRRNGEWSEPVETRPLRLSLLVDATKPWL